MSERPIIIDTDPGIDDTFAIAAALFSDELDARLIPTVAGSVDLGKVTYNALRLLKCFGREDVSVAVGADRSLIRESEDVGSVHGKSGMEGLDFEEPTQQPLKENAVDAMCSVIMNSSELVILVLTTPLADIMPLLKTYPEVKWNIREIVFMGGSASRGNKGVMAEFSITLDPEAVYTVLHSGVKLTMAGLDVGLEALVLPEDSGEIRIMNKTGEMTYCPFKKYRGGGFRTGLKMHDITAVAYLLKPKLFEAVETYLDVELRGMMTAGCTLVDLKGYLEKEPNATVCLDIDGNAFHTWLKEATAECR